MMAWTAVMRAGTISGSRTRTSIAAMARYDTVFSLFSDEAERLG